MQLNFAFIRHGHGCHNAVGPLVNNGVIRKADYVGLNYSDPELTQIGVDTTIQNGCIVSKLLQQLNISYMNVVVCSPLLRCMETAFFMTRGWQNPPKTIYVMPHLREINESASAKGADIFSGESFRIMETTPEYAMKDIEDQKAYLKKKGMLKYFDFSFVEKYERQRKEAGHVQTFVQFFVQNFVRGLDSIPNPLNVLVVTHHGVLRHFSRESFPNNSGFLMNVEVESRGKITFNDITSLTRYLPSEFAGKLRKYSSDDYYCPSQRCGQICGLLPSNRKSSNKKLKRADVSDCKTDITFTAATRK